MGQNKSAEETATVRLLLHILSKRGITYNETSVRRLLKWCRNHGYPADTLTAFEPAKWAEISEQLWDAISKGDQHASELATTGNLVLDT